jgi:hypothetical protein
MDTNDHEAAGKDRRGSLSASAKGDSSLDVLSHVPKHNILTAFIGAFKQNNALLWQQKNVKGNQTGDSRGDSISYARFSKAVVPIMTKNNAPPTLEQKGKLKAINSRMKRGFVNMMPSLRKREKKEEDEDEEEQGEEESINDLDTLLAIGELICELLVLACTIVR